MKKVLLLVLSVWLTAIFATGAGAQRYKDVVFKRLIIDSIPYCTAGGKPLLMDIYQPADDTASLRPLVILAHGGSFMHGNRHSDRLPAMCRELASRGYVAVSIDYRLTNLAVMAARPSAYRAIVKSVADGRASVAWFLRDIANGNTYRVDKNKLFFGGSSAGAILAEQLAFIDSAAECKPVLCKAVRKFLSDTGALPPHALRGIISLAGAVLDTSLISANQPALLHIHGDADRIVPYGYKRAVNGLAPIKMAGLAGSKPRYISQHLNFSEYIFKNSGHTTWDQNDAEFEIVMQQVIEFLLKN
jgi:para-nitrobenzyl esterase